ncbi:MAG TPA: hypothetical protein VKA68_07055 [bacterium]|nr:hypothetical protein [bacterium]
MPVSIKYFSVIILLLIVPAGAVSQELGISGNYRGEFEILRQDSSYRHQHWLNLIFEKSLGQDAGMHLNVEFNNYGTDAVSTLIQEAYVDYYTDRIDWRFGKQVISWGSAYQLNPTGYFNPYDLTLITPGEKRLGVLAAAGRYYGPARIEVSGVIAPFFSAHQWPPGLTDQLIGEAVARTHARLNQQVPQVPILLDRNTPYVPPAVPSKVENTTAGLLVTKRGLGKFDVSVSAYHGWDKSFAVDEEATGNSIYINPDDLQNLDRFATVYFFYPEVNRVGVNVIGSLGKAGVWLEGTRSQYYMDQFRSPLNIAGGMDYRFSNDLYIVGQGIYIQKRTQDEEGITAVMAYASKPVFGFHEIEIVGLYDFESDSYFLEPQFNYSLGNAIHLDIGGTLVEIKQSQYAEMFSRIIGERLYARLSIDF